MNTIFNTGVSGMIANQKKLDKTAHNIANVNTVGYKPEKAVFDSLVYTNMDVNAGNGEMAGHGVRQSQNRISFRQGTLTATGNPLDFAIAGEGFFAVEKDGAVEYTRKGSFSMSLENYRTYLVTEDGARVLDRYGRYVTVDLNYETGLPDYEQVKDSIGIFNFDNPYALDRAGSGRWLASAASGAAAPVYFSDAADIRSGYLEASAVDIGEEMVGLIEAQRAFQLSARIVQTADEIEQIVNNLR